MKIILALILQKLPEWAKLGASDDEERAGTSEMEMFFKVKIESENVTWRMRRKKTASFCPLPPPISVHASTSTILTFMGCHLKISMREGISRALSLGWHLKRETHGIFLTYISIFCCPHLEIHKPKIPAFLRFWGNKCPWFGFATRKILLGLKRA